LRPNIDLYPSTSAIENNPRQLALKQRIPGEIIDLFSKYVRRVYTDSGYLDPLSLALYNESFSDIPVGFVMADHWNSLCWFGSLQGYASLVIDACENALILSPNNVNYMDSRGLARALTGDIEGAISDFNAYLAEREKNIASLEAEPEGSNPNLEKLIGAKKRREGWIEALEAGENPFTEEVMKSLINESE
jgi:hypothetical protein